MDYHNDCVVSDNMSENVHTVDFRYLEVEGTL